QLQFVSARELIVKLRKPGSLEYRLPEGQYTLGGTLSPIDPKTRQFQASVAVEIGNPELKGDLPLYLRVELVGGFAITSPEIADEAARQWAMQASKFTLLPYLRENVAALSGRAGFTPIMLPLIQLPLSS